MRVLMTLALAISFLSATAAMAGIVIPGVYETAGESPYQDGSITIREQGLGYRMNGLLVRGEHLYEVEAFLDMRDSQTLRGSGMITVRYDNNRGCRHRFGVRIQVVDGQLWLYENTPQGIPYEPNSPCRAAGPYEWFHHPEPYVLQQ